MGVVRTKRMGSLDAAMLGCRGQVRRTPLMLAPLELATGQDSVETPVPEVVQQVLRLAQVFEAERLITPVPVETAPPADVPARRRVAFTLRLDSDRHGQLRQIARVEGRSAQALLVDAFDRYSAATTRTDPILATLASPRKATTGNQP